MKIDTEKVKNQYLFCAFCGGNLKSKDNTSLKCLVCKKNTYIGAHPCTATILQNKKGEVLLVKRAVVPKKDFWDLPGGFIAACETAEESAKRELKEELGISIGKLNYISSEYDTYEYQEIIYPTLSIIFSAKIIEEKFFAKDDISGFKFFKPEEIPFEKLAFESLKKGIRAFLKLSEKI